jgi:secreted Zn-dependent insulinase-like peptidase
MSAGISSEFEDFSMFEVNFSLTPEGFENWSQIISEMYEYMR